MKQTALAAWLALSLVQCSKQDGAASTIDGGVTGAGSAPAPAPAPSPPRTPFERAYDALNDAVRIDEVTVSPDGAHVAWVDAYGTGESSVRVIERANPHAEPTRITAGPAAKRERDLSWSPDSKSLAFLSDASNGRVELYVAAVGTPGSSPRRLTALGGSLSTPKFSPDGKTIALLLAETAPRSGSDVSVASEVRGERAPVQHLVLVDSATGGVRKLSRADLRVHEYDWSPDGARIAATATPPPGGDDWYAAQLFTVDARSGEDRAILKPADQIACPRWSPSGASIAYIGGLMSDQGGNGGDVFVVPADGGAPRNLTPDFQGSATTVAWVKERVVFDAIVDGGSAIATTKPEGGVELLWSGPDESIGPFSLSTDGAVSAVARESFVRPNELWLGKTGDWERITHHNDSFEPSWGEAKSVRWKSDAGPMQGWLVAPRAMKAMKLAPMVVVAHGGPASTIRPRFFAQNTLASEGYFVFYPNPRGSFGRGEAFTRANVKDFGGGDARDILSGVDEVLRTAPVDGHRLGLFGWSYGGFMTMWMITQTDRFGAAVAGAGIANWQSYAGKPDGGGWLVPYFGATVYDDPKVYAKSSPIEFVKRVKTPTLLLVGEKDGACPPSQSFEYWRALRSRGVATDIALYPGEGHHFATREHRRDSMVRLRGWFDAHLGALDTPGDH